MAALLLSGCSGGEGAATSGITSVLVMKHGRIVRESHPDGSLTGLGERLPWRRQITVRQLLSMTAGYAPSFDSSRPIRRRSPVARA